MGARCGLIWSQIHLSKFHSITWSQIHSHKKFSAAFLWKEGRDNKEFRLDEKSDYNSFSNNDSTMNVNFM